MDSTIDFDLASDLEKLCLEINPDDRSSLLSELSEFLKRESSRRSLSSKLYWDILLKLLIRARTIIEDKTATEEEYDFLTDVLRCMRNCVGGYSDDEFARFSDLFHATMNLILPLVNQTEIFCDKGLIAVRCGLQFIGNLVSRREKMKELVWETFFKNNTFEILLKRQDIKVTKFTLMIMYNCMTPKNLNSFVATPEGKTLLLTVLESQTENLVVWGALLFESVICYENFFESCYALLPIRNRLLILDMLAEIMENDLKDSAILENCLQFVKMQFVNNVRDIVRICDSEECHMKAVEIMRLLIVLCEASIMDKFQAAFQKWSDLLETAIDILKCVHLLGKNSSNVFTAMSSLEDKIKISREDLESHPLYCFKKNVIRLIGNLCSNHKENQDLVGKLDGIPLLMDCCNVDFHNPYIMQWCIFAIRNALRNNPQNQGILASISISEEMVHSPLLIQLNLEVIIEDGRPVLRTP